MNADDYRDALLTILRAHSGEALETLRALDAALPEKARAIEIGVHPSQDRDGLFTIMIHLDGPDLYVLNKAVDACRTLFDVRFGDAGRPEPDVPQFSLSGPSFEVNDVIVDTAFLWLEELWKIHGGGRRSLPVSAFGDDGYGSEATRRISP